MTSTSLRNVFACIVATLSIAGVSHAQRPQRGDRAQSNRSGVVTIELAHYCPRGDTLFLRDWASDRWTAQRPIGVRMTIDFVRPNGNRVRYSTDTTSRATIGDRSFTVVHTTVLTMDSTGRPMRRLTERYAPALVTAVGGRFETADSSAVGGWRETQRFELLAIREVGRR